MEIEIKDNNWTWGHVQRWTQDKPTWGSLVTTSCTNQHKEDMVHYFKQFLSTTQKKNEDTSKIPCTYKNFKTKCVFNI